MSTLNKESLIELCDYLEKRLTELVGEKEFRTLAKDKYKKHAFGIMAIAFELKHQLIMGLDPNHQAVGYSVDVMNNLYHKCFDKKNKPRKIMYNKPKNN